jgi:GxxExxY protein
MKSMERNTSRHRNGCEATAGQANAEAQKNFTMKSMESVISRQDAETQSKENKIGSAIVDAAIEVHRLLGPGLLESVYESALSHELVLRGFAVATQVPIDVTYKGIYFEQGFRADLIVEQLVVIELKSVEQVSAAHRKQLQTYLRLTDLKLGFLLNFGASLMKEGIIRAVNGLSDHQLSASLRLCARKPLLSYE